MRIAVFGMGAVGRYFSGRLHNQEGKVGEARKYLTKGLEIFERLGTLYQTGNFQIHRHSYLM